MKVSPFLVFIVKHTCRNPSMPASSSAPHATAPTSPRKYKTLDYTPASLFVASLATLGGALIIYYLEKREKEEEDKTK